MRLILLIIVILLLIGSLPTWPYSSGWGYYPSGGLGTILIILLILAVVVPAWPDFAFAAVRPAQTRPRRRR